MAMACSNDDANARLDISQSPSTTLDDAGDPRTVPARSPDSGPGNGLPSDVTIGGTSTGRLDASVLDATMPDGSSTDSAVPRGFTCNTDNDCAILNVGSCCGFFPRCANANATFTTPNCSSMTVGDCGFAPIDSCRCELNQCVSLQAGVPVKFP